MDILTHFMSELNKTRSDAVEEILSSLAANDSHQAVRLAGFVAGLDNSKVRLDELLKEYDDRLNNE